MALVQATPPVWRQIQRDNFSSLTQLAEFLQLTEEQRAQLAESKSFVLNLPLRLAQKIQPGTLSDPILRQFVPLKGELQSNSAFLSDPVGDQAARRSPKLLHKYQGRALLVCTSACAMHCRYCFRQHFDYESKGAFEEELRILAEDSSISEIILSGGDPLSLAPHTLQALLSSLDAIPHIQRIRFHTRFPIGIPERIDAPFLSMLEGLRAQVILVIHCNHALELDQDVLRAMQSIQKLGIPVLNQTVLLRGVNDSVEVLAELNERLVNHGIMPYYLHQLDRVQG
ncbi:MAG: KamA family radical SAM protein, partial [Chlamydiia bacterium]|nr:KamA family radical SAM protein [Chlamydiia bacterium]